jgi:hypothetical protein
MTDAQATDVSLGSDDEVSGLFEDAATDRMNGK